MRNEDLKAYGHSKKGITLVELIVAMTLTSIFAVLCVMLINPIERTYRGTLKLARAQLLADTLIDSIRKECDDVRHDETSDVWITDLSGNDDGQLFSDGPANKASSGNTLVFRRNNNYTEAIYAGVGISDANYTDVTGNALTPEHTAHSIDALKIAGSENMKAGYVHFGYYQAKEDDRGIFPIESYDYTNPVMAKTYGDFNVELKFYDLTLRDSKYPAYVMCKLTIMEKGKEVYSRSAVLCFAANGSGKGSGSHHPVNPTVRDIEVNVIWNDKGASDKRPASGLAFTLNNSSDGVLGTYSIADVRTDNTQRFVFKNINTANGWKLVTSPEPIPEYERTILKTANGFQVTYTRVNVIELIPGPDFNQLLRESNRHRVITSFVFAPSDESHLAMVQNSTKSYNVAHDTKTDSITDDYKLYLVKNNPANTYTAYVLSKTGTFNGNEIMGCMFEGCESATQFTGLELILTGKTKDMHKVFKNCKSLTTIGANNSIYIDWDTSSVVTYDSMFYNVASHSSLTDNDIITIDVSNFKFSKCKLYKAGTSNDNDQINGINKMFFAENAQVSRVGTIKFPAGHKDMHNLTQLVGVFAGCDHLTTLVDFSDWDCSGVTKIENVFTYCDSLRNVTITDWNLSGLGSVSGLFNTVKTNETILPNLETINLSGLNVSSATNLSNMFNGKTMLTTVDLSNCTTNSTSGWTMDKIFNNCTSLTTVDMTGFVNSKCTTMSQAFYNCSSLPDIDMSTWVPSGVTNMSYMFYGCSNLASSSADNQFEISNMNMGSCTTMQSAFQGCTSIKKLKFNRDTITSCTNYTDFIKDCTALNDVEISESDMSGAGGLKFLNGMTHLDFHGTTFGMEKLEKTFSKENDAKVVTIDFSNAVFTNCISFSRMFSGNDLLTSATFSGISAPKLTNCSYMFENCTGFSTYTFTDVALGACTTMEGMFSGCTELTSVFMSGLTTPVLKNCKKMFQNCSQLDVGAGNFAGWVTSSVTDMSYIFSNCINMGHVGGTVRFADMDLSSCTSMQNAFEGCTSMITLKLDNIDFEICNNFKDLYSGCTNFTTIEITNSNIVGIKNLGFLSSAKNIDLSGSTLGFAELKSTFANNLNIESFILNGTHFPQCTTFYCMFSGCKKLTKVEMVGLDTPVLTNCSYMFQNCYSLSIAEGKTSGWNSSSVTDVSFMFYGACYNGDENFIGSEDAVIDISGLKFTNITTFSHMFYNKKETYNASKDVLKKIILPSESDAVDNVADIIIWRMFNCREHLNEIRNLEHFSVSKNISNAQSAFARTGLTVLNISSLDLNKITGNADWIFNQNKSLTKIYVHPGLAENNQFATKTSDKFIFDECTSSLVGQNGTVWNNKNKGFSYAKVDQPGSSGYFSIDPNT